MYTAVYAGVTTAATGRIIGVEEGNGSFKEGRKEGWSCQQELLEFGSPTQCKMISTDVGVHIYRHTHTHTELAPSPSPPHHQNRPNARSASHTYTHTHTHTHTRVVMPKYDVRYNNNNYYYSNFHTYTPFIHYALGGGSKSEVGNINTQHTHTHIHMHMDM